MLGRARVWTMTSIQALSVNSLVPPHDFPIADFEAVFSKMTAHRSHQANAHFVAAWSALSYRYLAVTEYDDWFTASIVKHGSGPGHPIRYQQERDLFNFFSNGVSVLDAFCFGTYAIGTHTGSSNFKLANDSDERKVNWRRLISAYTKSFIGDPVISALTAIDTDKSLVAIRDARNILMHRAAPPRQIGVSMGPSAVPSNSTINRLNLTLDRNTTASLRREIVRLLSLGLDAMRTFVQAKL
jgi:hypothetical protein